MLQLDPYYPIKLNALRAGWRVDYVGRIIPDIQPGFASGVHNSDGVGVPHLRPMNIDREGRLDLSVVKSVSPSANLARIGRGEILFNNTNSPELVGKTTVISSDGEFAFSNHMTRLRPPDDVSPSFVAHQLHFLWSCGYFRHRCTNHVNQASISSTTLATTVPLVLPPRDEQDRIVAEIEKQFARIDAGARALRAAQAKIRPCRLALLHSAASGALLLSNKPFMSSANDVQSGETFLGDMLAKRRAEWSSRKTITDAPLKHKYTEPQPPKTHLLPALPQGWVWVSPDQISAGEPHSIGIGPFGSSLKVSDYAEAGVPLVFVRNIRSGIFDGPATKFITPSKAAELHAHSVIPGDVLITKMGEPPGDACIYPATRPAAVITADCIKLRPNSCIDRRYLAYIIGSPIVQQQIASITTGVAQRKVSLDRFRTIAIPLPPTSQQGWIADEIEARLSLLDVQERVVHTVLSSQTPALRASILKAAFNGQDQWNRRGERCG